MMVKLPLLVLEMGGMGISMMSLACRVVMGIRLCDEFEFGLGWVKNDARNGSLRAWIMPLII